MKQFSKILIILSVIIISGSGVVLAASSNLSCDNPEAYPWCKATSSLGGSTGLVNTFYNISLALVGVAAFGVIVYGGILYTISAGNSSKQQDAIEWITGAVYGVVLLFGAYFLLNTINPELVKLTDPSITAVEMTTVSSDTSCSKYTDSASCTGSSYYCNWENNKCNTTTGCCLSGTKYLNYYSKGSSHNASDAYPGPFYSGCTDTSTTKYQCSSISGSSFESDLKCSDVMGSSGQAGKACFSQ